MIVVEVIFSKEHSPKISMAYLERQTFTALYDPLCRHWVHLYKIATDMSSFVSKLSLNMCFKRIKRR